MAVAYLGDIALDEEDMRMFKVDRIVDAVQRTVINLNRTETANDTSPLAPGSNQQASRRRKRAATSRPERVWPEGVIPYVISGNFSGKCVIVYI